MKNKNSYIIIYATVLVVVVALALAFTSLALKDRQNANVENEMKGAILFAINQGRDAATAKDKTAYIDDQYNKYIVDSYAVNSEGDKVEGVNAFELLKNLKSEYAKGDDVRTLPVFVGKADDGAKRYVLPLYGTGLWGPVWGYLALESDWDTIYGAVFDHQGETPGLGAEITAPSFYNQFKGKQIFRDGQLTGIAVTKGEGSSADNPNAVDAITGGTITSRGVEDMLRNNLGDYAPYIEKQRAQLAPAPVAAVETLNTESDE